MKLPTRSIQILITCSMILLSLGTIHAQTAEAEEWIESILANADEDAELDLNTLLETYNGYLDSPLNLNQVTRDELTELFFLSDLEIEAIINHRNKHGNFIDLLELQSVETLPMTKVRLLASIATVNNITQPTISRGIFRDQKSELYLKWRRILESQKGYTDDATSPYLGDPNKFYTRYKYTAGNRIQMGLTAEKDAGEEFFAGSNKNGFDYYSGHLQIKRPIRAINQVILGDYAINLGQGLVAAMGFGTGKSTQVMNVKNRNKVLRPYTSVSEFNYLRGGALDLRISDNLDFILMASYQRRDANFFLDTINDQILRLYTSVPVDGFHRTENELKKEKILGFTDFGASIRYKKNRLSINANFLQSSFGGTFNTNPKPYQIFSGLQQTYGNASIDYTYIFQNFNFFGEVATDQQGDLATVNGMILGLDKNMEIAVVYRNISRAYQNLYGNSFTESSRAQNEEGIYVSSILRFNKNYSLHGYADFFRHPWLRFRVDRPSNGSEYYLKFEYYQKRKSTSYIQYFYEQKERNLRNESIKSTPVVDITRHRLRFHNNYKVNTSVELRNRVEFSYFSDDGQLSRGYLAYQDIVWRPAEIPLSATMRYAIFDTDDYDSRIYAYENDLLYEFSIPAYSNRGFRTYLNLRYRINNNFTLEGRISRTYLNDKDSFGSGNELIQNNRRTDAKAQLRIKF